MHARRKNFVALTSAQAEILRIAQTMYGGQVPRIGLAPKGLRRLERLGYLSRTHAIVDPSRREVLRADRANWCRVGKDAFAAEDLPSAAKALAAAKRCERDLARMAYYLTARAERYLTAHASVGAA